MDCQARTHNNREISQQLVVKTLHERQRPEQCSVCLANTPYWALAIIHPFSLLAIITALSSPPTSSLIPQTWSSAPEDPAGSWHKDTVQSVLGRTKKMKIKIGLLTPLLIAHRGLRKQWSCSMKENTMPAMMCWSLSGMIATTLFVPYCTPSFSVLWPSITFSTRWDGLFFLDFHW